VLIWSAINAPRNAQLLASLIATSAVLELVAPDAVRMGKRVIGPSLCISVAAYVLFGVPMAIVLFTVRDSARVREQTKAAILELADLIGLEAEAFFDKWVARLPMPLTEHDRQAGYGHRLSR